jgi:hypothetical protein
MTRNLARGVIATALLSGASDAANAQRMTASLELGGAQMRYADSINARAASITPSLTLEWPRATVDATFSRSNLGGQSWASQGRFSATAWTPIAGPFTAGADAWGGGSAHDGGPRTSQLMGTARLYAMASLRTALGRSLRSLPFARNAQRIDCRLHTWRCERQVGIR